MSDLFSKYILKNTSINHSHRRLITIQQVLGNKKRPQMQEEKEKIKY